MVFNILVDNTDAHEKNHVLLRQDDGSHVLSPAFDVLPAASNPCWWAAPAPSRASRTR